MVWNDRKIAEWAQSGGVTPFDAACVNPASLDLRLGNQIRKPRSFWAQMTSEEIISHIAWGNIDELPRWGESETFDVHWLLPGEFVLCHTLETVRIPDDCMALLFSKSSTGRIGLEHLHAGYADCGFFGELTLELHNVAPWPIKLETGKRYMQLAIFDMVEAALVGYAKTGRYQNQTGPTAAKAEKV